MAVKLCATLPDKLRLILKSGSELDAVSYTHLDVYKRQVHTSPLHIAAGST